VAIIPPETIAVPNETATARRDRHIAEVEHASVGSKAQATILADCSYP
jgi:hypothetical protein